MEEEIEPYTINQACWTSTQLGVLGRDEMDFLSKILIEAEDPLLVVGYMGREQAGVHALVDLANTIRGLKVLDTAGVDMCFPADHPAWLGLRYGEDESIAKADVILVLECDVCNDRRWP